MYTYSKLLHTLDYLKRVGVETGSIGFSEDGRAIPYMFVGQKETPCIFITAGIHAREHIGCYLVMRQAEYALNCFKRKPHYGIYFIPMLNPDGNVLIYKGADAMDSVDKGFLYELFNAIPRPLLKANARGVDLNVNFDAKWGTGMQNVFTRGAANYVGEHPFSERETRAIRDFTLAKNPLATVSYHCLGRELYWEFGQTGEAWRRDKRIAEYLNVRLDYKIVSGDGASAGGYKDWCIEKLGISAFTVELGLDEFGHPFTDYALAKDDITRNLDLPQRLLSCFCQPVSMK